MYSYILYSVDIDNDSSSSEDATKTIDSENYVAPIGWDNLQYAISRNKTYDGFFREFTAELEFSSDIKTWLRTIIDSYGLESEIQVTIKELNQNTFENVTMFSGVLNLSTYSENETTLIVNFEDSTFSRNIKNRENQEIEYNSIKSLNDTTLTGYVNEFTDLKLYGNSGSYDDDEGNTITIASTTTISSVYPFELFNKIIQKLTNSDYQVLRSSILGRTNLTSNGLEFDYAVNGKLALKMVTKGLLIRGWEENGTGIKAVGKTDLVVGFKKLFETFSKIEPLGLGIEKQTQTDGSIRTYVIIESKDYFYQNTEYTFEIDINNISELERIPAEEYHFNSVTAGQSSSTNNERFGAGKYNVNIEYSTPLGVFENQLSLVKDYRLDGPGIEELRWNPKSDTPDKKVNGDEDIFIIDAFVDAGGELRSKDNSTAAGFQSGSVAGVYGTNPLYYNLGIRSTYSVFNWSKWINVGLQKYPTEYLKFQKSEESSKATSQLTGETRVVRDEEDIPISSLDDPILTGYIYKFLSPLTTSQLQEIQNNQFGFVKFWNYIDNQWSYMWIIEVSTNPVDGETNWMGFETVSVDDIPGGRKLQENGDYKLQENGDYKLLEAS